MSEKRAVPTEDLGMSGHHEGVVRMELYEALAKDSAHIL